MYTHVALGLVVGRVEHAEDAGAAPHGVGDGVVVERVGAEQLQPLPVRVAAARRRQVAEQRRGGGLLLLLVVPAVTAGGVRGGVDGVPAAEEAVDERVAQRPRRVHHAHALPRRTRRLHGSWTHAALPDCC